MRQFFCRLSLLTLFILVGFTNSENPFNYDLHILRIPGSNGKTMVCLHGKGGDYSIAHNVKESSGLSDTIIGFNFPDYGIRAGQKSIDEISYGTIDELLPAIYVLKKVIIDEGQKEVNLYGFSAGGGALINILGALNTAEYDRALKKIGIHQKEKEQIVNVISKGNIILDTPLKSLREIIAFRGSDCGLVPFEKRYRENGMEPIDSLQKIDDRSWNIWLHFQRPDEVLSNRDDEMYIERLKKYNSLGKTHIVIGYDAGHKPPHPTLWKAYNKENEMAMREKKQKKYIVGIRIRTSNAEAQQDIPRLWERFRSENIYEKVIKKINTHTFAVYSEYEKDHTKPYNYTIGCEVTNLDEIPPGMCGLMIEEGNYVSYPIEGPFPRSLMQIWDKVWQSKEQRAYRTDYEEYPFAFDRDNSKGIVLNIGIK